MQLFRFFPRVSFKSQISTKRLRYKVKAIDWCQTRHMLAFCYEGNVPVLVFTVTAKTANCNDDTSLRKRR